DCTRARAEDGLVRRGKFSKRLVQSLFLQELQLRRALAARQDQPVAIFEILWRADFHALDTQAPEHLRMRFKVTLHRQNSDLHGKCSSTPRVTYQPRVDNRSFCSNCRTSMPGIASPRSSCASSTMFASSKA